MQFKNRLLRVISFLLATAFAVSCITVDKSMGGNYVPEDQKYQVKQISFPLPLTVKSMDSLQAMSSTVAYLGAIRTPEYGLFKTATIGNVAPATLDLDFGEDPQIKSIYFLAPVSYTTVMKNGQENIPQDIKIYKTVKAIDTTTVYSSSIDKSFIESEPLNLTSSTYFGGDSIKIFLKNEYGAELLKATEEELDSTALFVNRFKGLYLETSLPEDGLYGGRLNYLSYGTPMVVLEYNFKPTWEEGLSRKDTIVSLALGGDGFYVNPCTYSSADLQSDQMLETLPLEGVGGVKPYIKGSTIKGMLNNWLEENDYDASSVAIVKAEFNLPFEVPADLDMTKYPKNLFPTYWATDSLMDVYNLIYDVYATGNNQGAMSRALQEYYGDFSSYIQEMLTKEDGEITANDDLWFSTILSYEDGYGNTSYLPNNDQYFIGNINGPTSTTPPTMKIVYTIIK